MSDLIKGSRMKDMGHTRWNKYDAFLEKMDEAFVASSNVSIISSLVVLMYVHYLALQKIVPFQFVDYYDILLLLVISSPFSSFIFFKISDGFF